MSSSGAGFIRERIQKAFLRNLLKRQGSALFGRALPFGIGAVVGGAGNLMMGRTVVANAKEAFGPMPDTVPGELNVGGPRRPLESGAADNETAVDSGTAVDSETREGGAGGSER
jgi:hypothetical protein